MAGRSRPRARAKAYEADAEDGEQDSGSPRLAKWLAIAAALATMASAGCASTGRPRSYWLLERARAGLEHPTDERGWMAVAYASQQVGKRYCWGGTGPRCFDCSGLVQRAWAAAGIVLPRTADRMADDLVEVALSEVRAGDIMWWPGHVGLYAGNGWLIEALDSRSGVVLRPAIDPARAFRACPYCTVQPPSTASTVPVTRLLAGDAR